MIKGNLLHTLVIKELSKGWNWNDQFPQPQTGELCKKMQKAKNMTVRNLKVKVIDKSAWMMLFWNERRDINLWGKKTIQSFEK